ncbi:hypothetical protein K469DRAFT_720922 [Zopfia rhizophila CBS 207.26]|uniref:Uncharacterized protein n=1 Tax=Zopfia rhizophila CBS 207.26 TaxID=1314779 RepID=A0A6A6DGZ9_9PEZI|nr:hypothetical protein K469DRAFT_720922 [Zopfia rhizophila CBS 207.26]
MSPNFSTFTPTLVSPLNCIKSTFPRTVELHSCALVDVHSTPHDLHTTLSSIHTIKTHPSNALYLIPASTFVIPHHRDQRQSRNWSRRAPRRDSRFHHCWHHMGEHGEEEASKRRGGGGGDGEARRGAECATAETDQVESLRLINGRRGEEDVVIGMASKK